MQDEIDKAVAEGNVEEASAKKAKAVAKRNAPKKKDKDGEGFAV